MAVTIEIINVKDTIGNLRIKANNNFSSIKDEFTAIAEMIDTSNSNIKTENITLLKASRATSVEILTVEASGRFKGNFTVVGDTTVNNLTMSNGKTFNINSGNLNVKGAASKVDIEGDLTLQRNIIHKDYADSALDASNVGTFLSVSANVGILDVNNKHAIILDFANYSSSANVSNTHDVKDVELKQGLYQGQQLTIVAKSNSSAGKPHRIANANISSLADGEFIQFFYDYCVAEFVYVGSGWVIKNLYNANIA